MAPKYILPAILGVAVIGSLVYFLPFVSTSQPTPVPTQTPVVQQTRTDFSDGSCNQDIDCKWIGEGCGGGHGVCTSDRQKISDWETQGGVSTCDVNLDHPSQQGYQCGCVQKKCGWKK